MNRSKDGIASTDGLGAGVMGGWAKSALRSLRNKVSAPRNPAWHAIKKELLPYLVPVSGPDALAPDQHRLDSIAVREVFPSIGLQVALVQYGPDEIVYIERKRLSSLQVSEEVAWKTAYSNLDKHLGGVSLEASDRYCRVSGWTAPDGQHEETAFAATLLLSRSFRTRLCDELRTERCIVGIPNRHTLMAAAPDFEVIDFMVDQFQHDLLIFDHGITAEAFLVHRSGDWEHLDGPEAFVKVLGRSLLTNIGDGPHTLPGVWNTEPFLDREPWVRHSSALYSVDYPRSWEATGQGNSVNLVRTGEEGRVTVSAYANDTPQPAELHKVFDRIRELQEELGQVPVQTHKARRMRGWTGVYFETVDRQPVPMYMLWLGACRGSTWVLATAQDRKPTGQSMVQYLRVFGSLRIKSADQQ